MAIRTSVAELALKVLLGALLAVAASAQSSAPRSDVERSSLEQQHFARTRLVYGQTSWPRSAARAGLANELALAGFRSGALDSDQGRLTREFRHTDATDAPAAFVLESRVADSVEAAQELLIEWLAGLQSPARAPDAAEVGLTFGDVAFVGRSGAGPGVLSWIAFVRGNVAVRVSACDPKREPGLDLPSIAAAVDQAVASAAALETGRVPARPVIASLALPTASAVAGAVLPVDVTVADPAGGTPHLQWVVGGPGQGYVERSRDGQWRLHTTGPGPITLALEVTGSTGTWMRREIALDVLDD
jgi:hypothetical protein